jgi:hypothetical protein
LVEVAPHDTVFVINFIIDVRYPGKGFSRHRNTHKEPGK